MWSKARRKVNRSQLIHTRQKVKEFDLGETNHMKAKHMRGQPKLRMAPLGRELRMA